MEEFYQRVQVYLNMEEEIDFDEFEAFYKEVMKELDANGLELEEEDLWKALFIVESLTSNAKSRIKEDKKKQKRKKYKKMHERTKVWAQNFTLRLHRAGYNEDQINQRFEAMLAEDPTKEQA
ncbi:hypothetical protein B0H94_10120 [Salsuginibacillus halophilus]|uniref:Uncharacterized protein n=1 Tax=Salsuginibacillus halophilus TaxID=517424 RepID=A0A2P8HXY0_9BACI|nr:hypothetical protein [Salsuginibacillus halophilus]PSL51111.1 hypothetical protein B0H94_10120 [Salsuginibacillus halophilus]